MRLWLAALWVAFAGPAEACGNAFGALDNENAVWRAVLGIEFRNPVVKVSSMNDICWGTPEVARGHLADLWRFATPRAGESDLYRVPAVRIVPDYATYPDDREAYENGQVTGLGHDTLRLSVVENTEANRAAVQADLAALDPGEGVPERFMAETDFGGVAVTLYSARVKGGFLSGSRTISTALFEAPGRPGTLVIVRGHVNGETDRVAGIPVEETLHQVVRAMRRADPAALACPMAYDLMDHANDRLARRLGVRFAPGAVTVEAMAAGCWLRPLVNEKAFARFEPGDVPPDAQVPLYGVWRAGPDGVPDKSAALVLMAMPRDFWDNARPGWIADGALPVPPELADRRVRHYEGRVVVNGVDLHLFTTFVDGPGFGPDSYESVAVFEAPAQPGHMLMLRGPRGPAYDRIGGVYVERALAEVLALLRVR